jgi:hypothetical protein
VLSGDLEYQPELFRAGARQSYDAADRAEGVARRLRGAAATGFGGNGSFEGALNATRERHASNARRAAEERDAMAGGANNAANAGEELDRDSATVARHGAYRADSPASAVSRQVTDGMR